jgi:DNA primase large subunit
LSKKGFIDRNGNISHHWVSTYTLFANEIGLTPEEAVINEVTF